MLIQAELRQYAIAVSMVKGGVIYAAAGYVWAKTDAEAQTEADRVCKERYRDAEISVAAVHPTGLVTTR